MQCNNGKVRFKTRRHADDRALEILRTAGVKMRPYLCPFGDPKAHWHLTHLTIQQFAWNDDRLRIVAQAQARDIEKQECEYLQKRLRDITEELTTYWENLILEEFRKSLDRRAQREILRELGFVA